MVQRQRARSQRSKKADDIVLRVHTKFVRIAHHKHSGRKIPIHYTSYAVLFFLLVLTGVSLLLAGGRAMADATHTGNVNVSALVQGPPPNQAAVISSPRDNERFDINIIQLEGKCQPNQVIEAYRYSIFSGTQFCTPEGTFKIHITLQAGRNDLRIRTRDVLRQYGPDSGVVTVYYDPPKPPPPGLFLYTRPIYDGFNRGDTVKIKYEIDGGKQPFAVSINWSDDSRADLVSLDKVGDYEASHIYQDGGQYTITISATDQNGTQALIQVVVVINEKESVAAPTIPSACIREPGSFECFMGNRLQQFIENLWPAFIIACLMTASFWFGERIVYSRIPQRRIRA